MVVTVGVTRRVPLKVREPVQPTLAVQLVALVEDQVSVVELPVVIEVGEAEKVMIGAGVAVTVTTTLSISVPPAPIQVRVYVVVTVGETLRVPLRAREPLQPLLAVQLVALVEDQVRVVELPVVIEVGEAEKVMIGAGSGSPLANAKPARM